MTLHEAIYQTLIEADRPMTSSEVADAINSRGLYTRKDNAAISATQIKARITNYPQEFEYVQGEIILTKDNSWNDILKTHKYLENLFRDIISDHKGTLIVFLIFYKFMRDSKGFDEVQAIQHVHQLHVVLCGLSCDGAGAGVYGAGCVGVGAAV
jgi:hypothetical protein